MTAGPADLAAALEGRCRIERELGRGGMATVFLAEDLRHKRPVGIKLRRPKLGAVVGADRFLREIEITAGLQHPNILPLHDSGLAGRVPFYVMPYIAGESLRDRIARERLLPVDAALGIVRDVASALRSAPDRGAVHRHVKLENIVLHEGQALAAGSAR